MSCTLATYSISRQRRSTRHGAAKDSWFSHVGVAEQGFVTLSIDLSFWGESEGQPRNAVAPDVYAEAFSAAVDFLGTRPFVDRERIGVPRDLRQRELRHQRGQDRPAHAGHRDGQHVRHGGANRHALKQVADPRAAEEGHRGGGGTALRGVHGRGDQVHRRDRARADRDTHPIQREFYDFYRTPRGEFTPAGSSPRADDASDAQQQREVHELLPVRGHRDDLAASVLFITGDKAHSREFSEDAYKLAAEPKELVIVPGAGHVDLYDRVNLIPFDKLTSFFTTHLK